jgi:alpha-tubulin suppressor-like RCC1 family protein
MIHSPFILRLSAGVWLSLLTVPAFAQSATRLQLFAASPSAAGEPVTLSALVDSLGAGAPTGNVAFADGATVLGSRALTTTSGVGQATLAAGFQHACALHSSGGVQCWGNNGRGQLGDGTLTSRSRADWVSGLRSGVVAVAAGYRHSCALTDRGAVKCWGWNSYGQLGDGANVDRAAPVQVAGLESGVIAIAAGAYHSCALTDDGGVKCWGYNRGGQLGNGIARGQGGYTPSAIAGPANYTALAVGWSHSCALTRGGAVKCWGENTTGAVGDGTTTNRALPTEVHGLAGDVVALTALGYQSCAITSAGALYCWGYNRYGQIGDGTTTDRYAPVQVSGLSSGVVAAAAGYYQTCALMGTGDMRCWGGNGYGQLGDGSVTPHLRPSPVRSLGAAAVAVASGGDFSCASLVDRIVRCWGNNVVGQIGDGTNTVRLLPATTTGLLAVLRARANISTTALVAGWHLLRARYAGDARHGASSAIIPYLAQ